MISGTLFEEKSITEKVRVVFRVKRAFRERYFLGYVQRGELFLRVKKNLKKN